MIRILVACLLIWLLLTSGYTAADLVGAAMVAIADRVQIKIS